MANGANSGQPVLTALLALVEAVVPCRPMPVKFAGEHGYGHREHVQKDDAQQRPQSLSEQYRPQQGSSAELRANVAAAIGLRPIAAGLRLNVGLGRKEHEYVSPTADFECWGWMTKKGARSLVIRSRCRR